MKLYTLYLFCITFSFAHSSTQAQQAAPQMPRWTSPYRLGDTVRALGKNIDCLLQDAKGNYWFATNGDGIYRYDGKILVQFTEKDGLCCKYVFSLQEDSHGNIWISTHDGICRYDGTGFVNFTDSMSKAVNTAPPYKKSGIFFSQLNNVSFYDGQAFTNFIIHPSSYKPEPSSLNRPYGVYSTLIDKDNNIWFGTQSKGVCRYDGKSFQYFTEKNLEGPAVRCVFQDKAGNLWFGNNGGGLFHYDGTTLRNITEEQGLTNLEFLHGKKLGDKPGSLARVFAINEDSEGNLWIGTADAGVWKYDGKTLKNYTTKDGLGKNSVIAMYKDKQGTLWFADMDAVYTFNGSAFTKFTLK